MTKTNTKRKRNSTIILKSYSVPHPIFFWGCWFFDKCSQEKKRCASGESGDAVSPPQWVQG